MLVAVTVTCARPGNVAGAEERPVGEIVPTVVLPPTVPFTAQVTAVFKALFTMAVNCACPLCATSVVAGATAIVTAGVMVTLALAELRESATLTAVTVTCGGLGIAAGAV